MMAKSHLLCFFIIAFGTCVSATTYTVGDSSGWDISTDLDTWPKDKSFQVGDVLVFQYSSSDSLSEVTKQDFNSCDTKNAIKTYSNNGNATIALTKPGEIYFISGNKLYCLGGMKLKLNVEGANSPVAAPQPQPGGATTTQPSSKTNTPSTVFHTSTASMDAHASLLFALLLGLSVLVVQIM